MGIEGRLEILLTTGGDAVKAVEIRSSRPVLASRAFHGKGVAESQEMLQLLFSVCATAQSCAGVRACEQALGLQATPAAERLRDLLVRMETVREHLWRILLDWPAFVDGNPDREGMAETVALQRDFRQALCPGGNAFRIGGSDCTPDIAALSGVVECLAGLLRRAVFAIPAEQWLALTDERALAAWAGMGETSAAVLVDEAMNRGWRSAGACLSVPLPPLEPLKLNAAMQDDDYIRWPRWSGACCETTSLTRTSSPLLTRLAGRYGNGLLVRLVARLTELAVLADRLSPDETGEAAPVAIRAVDPDKTNSGVGQAAAARGQLAHRVELIGERIASYRILAPTEWNFHPQGVVAHALSTLRGSPRALERQARLLINAIDPCVGYELGIVQGCSESVTAKNLY